MSRRQTKGFPPQNDILEIPKCHMVRGGVQDTRVYALEREEKKNLSHLGYMAGNMVTGVLLEVGGEETGNGEGQLVASTHCCMEA